MQDREPDDERAEEFVSQGMGIRDNLQSVEYTLIDAGYDDFVVATEHGTFRWMTIELHKAAGSRLTGEG